MHLPRGETRLLQLVGSIYDAAMDSRQWPNVLRAVAGSVNAPSAMLRSIDGASKRVGFLHTLSYDEFYLRAYREHFFNHDPYQNFYSSYPVGTFKSNSEYRSTKHLRSEYFNDYERPQDKIHAIGAPLARDGASMIQIGFHRGRRSDAFGADDLQWLTLLSPHISRAVQMHRAFAEATKQHSLALASLDQLRVAIFLTDAASHPFHVNRAAERLLSEPNGLRVLPDGLAMSDPGETSRLRVLIAKAALTTAGKGIVAGGEIFGAKTRNGQTLQIRVAPLSRRHLPEELHAPLACASVFVSKQGATQLGWRNVAGLFGLTPAEAKLAVTVARGKTLEETAAASGASIHTVRNQMKSALAKTGMRRQSELVALLLGGLLAQCPPENEEDAALYERSARSIASK